MQRISANAKAAYGPIKANIQIAAEKMPEENYSFKPVPEVESFGERVFHSARPQLVTCSGLTGDQKTITADPKATKAQLVAALASSFAACDKAFDALTDANALDSVTIGRGPQPRIALLYGLITHANEVYGAMGVYMPERHRATLQRRKVAAMRIVTLMALAASLAIAQKIPTEQLLLKAQLHSPDLEQAIRDTFNDPKDDKLAKGSAYAGEHGQFLFAVISDKQPLLQVNQMRPEPATKVGGLWVYQGPLKQGTSYRFTWLIEGKAFGGANDVAAFSEEAYLQPGVPRGKQVGPFTIESKIYPGMKARMWYYTPAQWDGRTPLPLQFWGDGQFYTATRPDGYRLLDTFDNLFAEKRIPLMANVFVEPGTAPQRNIRSIEYDTVDDKFAHYLLEEVFPEVEKHIPLRHDAYSRALVGESSGGICAFNAAYFMPDQFSRVLSWIGSFAALQTSEKQPTGGAAYPVIVRQASAKKNIRVWLQDGAEDQENPRAGSWPLANIELANSLKIKGYDYHLSFGVGTHSQRQGSAELPQSLVWLWRDYDSTKTSQEFTPEPEEKDKPLWRVVQLTRE